ncbi:hypothetical protein KDAU_71130 [Dictyobacter aurantiacus]|uniref:Uncharacterized protein n=1 Tax=Dictyobacter aurantiacus TaxID=1936993 RepID=A0A401ZSM5_9CHLR|nr:hypothetical protein KDAU_71130 [Dictyobacter aurantiacus]
MFLDSQALNNANKRITHLEEEKMLQIAAIVDKTRKREAYKDILVWCKKVKTSCEDWIDQRYRDVPALKAQQRTDQITRERLTILSSHAAALCFTFFNRLAHQDFK